MSAGALAAQPSIAVVGAGAIGSRLAAHLASHGQACTLFDGWADHVQAINRDGLVLEGFGPPQRHALRAFGYQDAASAGRHDIVLLCTRSDATAPVLPLVRALLEDEGCVVSCQNGINEEAIAAEVGIHRTLGCSLVLGARLAAPGRVVALPGEDTLRTGELAGGASARLDRLVALLGACGTSTATPNLLGYRWMKLVLNSIGNPLLLLSGLTAAELHARPDARALMVALAREVLGAARAGGVQVSPVLGIAAAQWLDPAPPATAALHEALQRHGAALGPRRLSMVADFEARGRTEVDFINGHVVRQAARHGLAAPLNAAVVQRVHQLEAGGCRTGWDRITELAAQVSA